MGLFNRQFHLFRQPPIGCIALFEWSVLPQRVETGVCCLAPAPKFRIGKAAFGAVCAGMYAYIGVAWAAQVSHAVAMTVVDNRTIYIFGNAATVGANHFLHSLSVSDVVVLHQNGQDTAHYCDSMGFQQVPEFLRENPLRTAELSTEQNENMIDGVLNNAPSLGELEAKAKAGEQISLTDLAAAVKAEEKAPKAKKSRTAKPKKPSIRAQLDAVKKEQSKQTPPREKIKELEV